MNDLLENEDLPSEDEQGQTPPEGGDETTGPGDGQEPQPPEAGTGKEINQDKVNAVINKKHRQMREAQEAAEAEKQRADQLQARIEELQPNSRPTVPPKPKDVFAEDYDAKLQEWATATRKAAEYDAQQNLQQQKLAEEQQQALQRQAAAAQQRLDGYRSNAKELGIKDEQVAHAATIVNQYTSGSPLETWLLEQKDGPAIVNYLSNNVEELVKVADMNPFDAVIHIRTAIPKNAFKPAAIPAAPDPEFTPEGGSAPQAESPYLKGGVIK